MGWSTDCCDRTPIPGISPRTRRPDCDDLDEIVAQNRLGMWVGRPTYERAIALGDRIRHGPSREHRSTDAIASIRAP